MFIKEIVIGSSLESKLYVLLNSDSRLLKNKEQNYYDFEKLKHRVLSCDNKRDLNNKLGFTLSMMGKLLTISPPDNIREDGKNLVATLQGDSYKFSYGNLIYFDELGTKVKVIDHFEAKNIKKTNNFRPINTGDDFIKCIFPENSGRILGSKHVTDFYTLSEIENERIHDFEVSETMARFKLQDILRDNGFVGTVSSYLEDGSRKYSNIKLIHSCRLVKREKPKMTIEQIFYGKKR